MILSFIVPVYNVEPYLECCIKSIINQPGNDFEVILVDDGSTDGCGAICDKYAQIDPRVSSYHKKNGGLSDARNYGIKCARGKYLAFVDADDFIGEKAIEVLTCILKEHRHLDVILMEGFKFYPDNKKYPLGDGYKSELIVGKTKSEVLEHLVALKKFPASACTKIVNRKFIEKNKLYFVSNLISEDVDWSLRVLLSANSFWYSSYQYYFYRQNRNGSITHSVNSRRLLDLLSIIEYHTKPSRSQYREYTSAFLAYEMAVVILLYFQLSPSSCKKDIACKIRNLSWVLTYGRTKKIRLVKYCYLTLGLEVTSFLLNIFKRILDKCIIEGRLHEP